MVIVRSKITQHWRGNKYYPGDKMPATEDQGRRLTSAGVAYYDIDESPNPSWTVKQIKDWLDEEGIEYSTSDLKQDLLELADGE